MFGKLMRGQDMSEFQEKVDDRTKQPKYVQELTSYRDDMEYIRKFNLGISSCPGWLALGNTKITSFFRPGFTQGVQSALNGLLVAAGKVVRCQQGKEILNIKVFFRDKKNQVNLQKVGVKGRPDSTSRIYHFGQIKCI